MSPGYTFLSNVHGTFFSIDYMLGHETCHKYKKIEIIQGMFSSHRVRKLENSRRKFRKFTIMWTLNTTIIKTMSQRGNHSRD